MTDIKAADVAKLRKETGAGMMDCKKALVEANGDFDAAILLKNQMVEKQFHKFFLMISTLVVMKK